MRSLCLLTTSCLVLTAMAGCARSDPASRFLREAWPRYRAFYIAAPGYVVDPLRSSGAATSEGQGYALLRAFWEHDEETFERVFAWTEANLRRPDGLYSWLWSPADGGRVLDANTATDGDQEIAWALAMAGAEFDEPRYTARARELVQAVRAKASVAWGESWFPAAGNWATEERIVNLSYFTPYAYGWFDALDPGQGWSEVADVGYDLLDRVLADGRARLVPDFITVDSVGAPGPLPSGSELSRDFSFDAVRIFWRVEADCALTGRRRACADPLHAAQVIPALLVDDRIVTRYDVNAAPLTDETSLSFYGALLTAARRHAPDALGRLARPRADGIALARLLDASDRYYDHNWVWFGIALESGLLEARTPAAPGRD